MMAIYILLLVYLVQCGKAESGDLLFASLPLCDTAILVYWKPMKNESEEQIQYSFFYQEIQGTDPGPQLRAWRKVYPSEGQIKLNNLKENTKYRISVYKEKKSWESSRMLFFMDSKTREIDFLEPAKPDFDYKIYKERIWNSNLEIKWYPCGKEHKCHDKSPGCSFYVKYRIKGATEFHKVSEYNEDYLYIRDCLPGKVYQFIVASNNIPFETESNMKEIVVPPEAGPVTNLEALPLGSFSVLLTWDPPFQVNGNLTGYKIFYEEKEKPYKFIHRDRYDNIASNRTRVILSHLQPNTAYRISIAVRTDNGLGSVNSIDVYTSKYKMLESALFKPQAVFDIIDTNLDLPKLKLIWLPCGSEKYCQGLNSGSYFEVKYKLENESAYCHLSQYDQDLIIIENLLLNATYEFIVVSVDQTSHGESNVYKIILPHSGQRVYESIEGNNVTLPCSSNPSDKVKVKPKWLKNDVELTLSKFIQQPNGDLLITNVSIGDSGKYACTVPSSPLKMDDLVFLSVKSQTKVKLGGKSKRQELRVGEKYSLRCQANTDSTLSVYSYEWLKDGNRIHFNASISLAKSEINVLQFLKVNILDSGNYTCKVNTRLDTGFNSVEIIVLP